MNKIEYYKDAQGEWRWRVKRKNGEIVAESGEGYEKIREMHKTLSKMINSFATALSSSGEIPVVCGADTDDPEADKEAVEKVGPIERT